MLLAQSLVRRHPHSQIKDFVTVKYFVSTLFVLFGMHCHAQVGSFAHDLQV